MFEACAACDSENRVGTRFCGKCGADQHKLRNILSLKQKATGLMTRAGSVSDREATVLLAEASTVWRQLLAMSPEDKDAAAKHKETDERWAAACRKIAASLTELARTRSAGEAVSRLAEARQILSQVLAVLPTDSPTLAQLQEVEAHLYEVLSQRTQVDNPTDAAAAHRELLQYFPQDQASQNALKEYADDLDAARAGVRMLLNSGEHSRTVRQANSALIRFRNDPELLAMKQKAQEEQSKLVRLTEQEIPKLWDERRCIAMLARLNEVEDITTDVANLQESRQLASAAIAQARLLTTQGDQLLASHKGRQALATYQQALKVCSDFGAATTGVARATTAIKRAAYLRNAGIVAAAVALVAGAVVWGYSLHQVRQDNRGWTEAESKAQTASHQQKFEEAQEHYRNYLENFLHGRHVSEARYRITSLEVDIEKREWNKLDTLPVGTRREVAAFIEASESFRQRFSESKYSSLLQGRVSAAKSKLDDLDWKEAHETISGANKDYAKVIEALLGYINKHPASGRAQVAQQQLNEARTKQEREDKLAVARKSEGQGKWQDAIKIYNQLWQLYPRDSDVIEGNRRANYSWAYQLATQNERDGNLDEAEHFYQQALLFLPPEGDRDGIGRRLEEIRKRKRDAIRNRAYDEAIERARQSELTRDWAGARSAYNDALAAKADDFVAGNGKAYCEAMIQGQRQRQAGNLDAARAEFQKALELRQDDFEAKQQLAALRQQPLNRPSHQNLPSAQSQRLIEQAQAEASKWNPDWARVEMLASEALKTNPNDELARALVQRARQEQYRNAMKNAAQALSNADWHRRYASAYNNYAKTAQSYYSDAMKWYDVALKLQPRDPAATEGKARAQRALIGGPGLAPGRPLSPQW